MTANVLFPDAPDLSANDYCVFGLATCYHNDEGDVRQISVVEPIPSAYLEALVKGVPTSYRFACAKTLGEVLGDCPQIPAGFPADAQFCDRAVERTIAAARTYKSHAEVKTHIPLGTVRDDFNYSLERKRVLNVVNVVRTEDNVKQHSHTHKVL